METPTNIPSIPYDELVFCPIKKLDVWRGPWHRDGSWGVLATLKCGHQKAYSRTSVPKNFVHCLACSLKHRSNKHKNKFDRTIPKYEVKKGAA